MPSVEKFPPFVDVPAEGGGRATIRAASAETLFIKISIGPEQTALESYAVVEDFTALHPVIPIDEQTFHLGNLRITVEAEPLRIVVSDKSGNQLFAASKIMVQEDGRVALTRELSAAEGVYGLGEHGEGFNRNPGLYRIWNRDEFIHHPFKQYYCTIPFAVCGGVPGSGFHGILVDNPGELTFDVGHSNASDFKISTRHGDLNLWLSFAETPAEILKRYVQLTGHMERPPIWALGFQQCRWSYMSADRVREVAQQFRTRGIPCDVLYLDIDYMQDYCVFTWNKSTFANPKTLIGDLHEDGFRTLCIVDPGIAIVKGYHAYDTGTATPDFFLRHENGDTFTGRVWPGDVHMPDFSNPTVRQIWGRWQKDALLANGIAGIWNDMNEPAIFGNECGSREFPPDIIHHDFGHHRRHEEVHNTFGLTMAQASHEGQLAAYPSRRPFTLTRSGWAGIQRHSAVWTGDNRSAFSTMPLDIALNLNMGMSGQSFVGCDIGGFQGNATPELFARWIEWGVFQAFCRCHSAAGTVDHEPWAFGPEVERVAKRMIELRYQLLPYIYAQFVAASETGLPINRPLVLENPNDASVLSLGDQFLIGRDLMVAPVLEQGKDHRAVYLPAGEWYDFWTERKYSGGAWILAPAPFAQPPLFVRAGAIIPMYPIRQSTAEPVPHNIYLDVWVADRLSGELIEDDGESRNYLSGIENRVHFKGRREGDVIIVAIDSVLSNYESETTRWTLRLHGVATKIRSVVCNGLVVHDVEQELIPTCMVERINQPMEIRIELESAK